MVNTLALESRGRGFKSRSRQFLEFHLCSYIYIYISTWSYENWASKHFVIFPNFRYLIACLLCCLLMCFLLMCFFFLACLVVRDLCRRGCTQNYLLSNHPPPRPLFFFPTHNFFFNTSDSYQFEISGRLRLVSVLFSSLVLYIGRLEKSFPESIM